MAAGLAEIGAAMLFLRDILSLTIRRRFVLRDIFVQVLKVTFQSVGTTALAGFFVGAIMSVQFGMQIQAFDAMGYLGGLATSGTVREVGPLLIAFMLAGKVGAFIAAELGTMRVTEQIDAIRCLGADPMSDLIVPRFWGIVIASFFLLMAGLVASLGGGLILATLFAGVTIEEYFRYVPTIVSGWSILSGLFKCAVFALTLALICTFKGFNASGGARGVGRAVVETAVASMVGIVVTDWLTSVLSDSLLKIILGDLA
jgi:phospholipid/cholesterol/gamma-HCH transport system permease protein